MKWILKIAFFFCLFKVQAQDYHFSQFYNNAVDINPANIGLMEDDYRFTSDYKDQWRTVSNPFVTELGAFDAKILKDSKRNNILNGGIIFINDKAGTGKMGYWFVAGGVSSSIKISKKGILSAGASGGIGRYTMNVGAFTWDSNWDGTQVNAGGPSEANIYSGGAIRNIKAGMVYNHTVNSRFVYSAGLTLNNILRPNLTHTGSGDKLRFRYTLAADAKIDIVNTNKSILPKLLVMNQGTNLEITPGCVYRYGLGLQSQHTGINKSSAIYLGLFYRTRDAIIFYTGYDYKHYVTIGLSYDLNLSPLTVATYSIGGFELTLSHSGLFSKNKKSSASFN